MREEILFRMPSPYRDDFLIKGYWFGSGAKTVAIVGSMRGDEIQQQYIAARIVEGMKKIETDGLMTPGKSILVIPSCNPFSMNVSRRFWTMDNTDINRMFPGYEKGETTQRIASAIFSCLQGFEYGIQLASFYIPGDFVPHVRMLKTGYEDVDGARKFGLQYVTTRIPLPYDTTLLNYNWQIWGTKAFSIYSGQTHHVENITSGKTIEAIFRFLGRIGALEYSVRAAGYESVVFDEESLVNVKTHSAGIYYRIAKAGDIVGKGQMLARILDAYDCSIKEEIIAPCNGEVFFCYNRPLALEHSILYRIIAI